MIYPTAVLVIAIGILTFIMIAIVPKFKEIFEELAIELPGMTEVLISISDTVGAYWLYITVGIMLFIIGAKILRNTESGGALVDRMVLRVPVLGNVIRKGSVAALRVP